MRDGFVRPLPCFVSDLKAGFSVLLGANAGSTGTALQLTYGCALMCTGQKTETIQSSRFESLGEAARDYWCETQAGTRRKKTAFHVTADGKRIMYDGKPHRDCLNVVGRRAMLEGIFQP